MNTRDKDYITNLNRDPTFVYASKLSPADLINHCMTSKKMNKLLCSNEKFWEYKWRLDFQKYEGLAKPENFKTYKEWYYYIIYNSHILYVDEIVVAEWVKKVIMKNTESYFLTIFEELYKFNNSKPNDIKFVASNIIDISNELILTNGDDKLCNTLEEETPFICLPIGGTKLMNDDFVKYDYDGEITLYDGTIIGKDIISVYQFQYVYSRPTIVYLEKNGRLIIREQHNYYGELNPNVKELVENVDVVLIAGNVKNFFFGDKNDYSLDIYVLDKQNHLYNLNIEKNHITKLSQSIKLIDKDIKKIIDYIYMIDINENLIRKTQEGKEIIAENVKDANVYRNNVGILKSQFL